MKCIITVLSIFLLLEGCSVLKLNDGTVIKIKGSDTMLILNQLWAEEYMKINPGVSIYCSGGGSSSGIKSLINGEVNICSSSRPIEPAEVRQLAKKYNSVGMSFTVAKDALSIYLNLDNPVSDLSLEQVKKIFTGKITNWKEVGGSNETIALINRPGNSGSNLYFKDHVLDGENYSTNAIVLLTTDAVVHEVMLRKNSIGYGGLAYSKAVINCSINGIVPTIENVQNNTYPIARYLFLYTVNMPTGEVKKFLDWIISKTGQQTIKRAGYIPLW